MEDFKERLKPHKNGVMVTAILLCGLLIATAVYFWSVVPHIQSLFVLPMTADNLETFLPLDPEIVVDQELEYTDPFKGIRLQVGTYEKKLDRGYVSITVYDATTNEMLIQGKQSLKDKVDNSYVVVPFEEEVMAESGRVRLRIRISSISEDDHVALRMTPRNETITELYDNGILQEDAINLRLMMSSEFLPSYYWPIAIFLVLATAGAWYVLFVKKAKLEQMFILFVLVFGIAQLFVYPSYGHYDEERHIPNTFYYAAVAMGQEHGISEDGVAYAMQREQDFGQGLTSGKVTRSEYHYIQDNFLAAESENQELIEQPSERNGVWYQYLPQIVGIIFAKLLSLGQIPTLYLGALFSLIFYLVSGYWIIKRSPLPTLFLLLSTVPFAIHTAASFSYDTVVNIACWAWIAEILHLAYEKPKVCAKDILLLGGLAIFIAPLKVIYIPIFLLILLIPTEKWRSVRTKWGTMVGCFLAGGGAVVYYQLPRLLAKATTVYGESLTPFGKPAYTVGALLQNPLELIRLVIVTGIDLSWDVLLSTVKFQYMNLTVTGMLVTVILLFLSVCPVRGEHTVALSKQSKALMAVSFMGVYGLGLLAGITWTQIGAYYLDGVQGRYFLPVLVLVILLSANLLTREKNNDRGLIFAMWMVNAYAVFYIFQRAIF